jgi:hypothetical protein
LRHCPASQISIRLTCAIPLIQWQRRAHAIARHWIGVYSEIDPNCIIGTDGIGKITVKATPVTTSFPDTSLN